MESALKNMYIELLEEKKQYEDAINNNNNTIQEITAYLNTVLTEENKSLSVFSPRNPINLYGERIKENKEEIDKLESNNRDLYKKLNKIDNRLDELKIILEKQNISLNDIISDEKVNTFDIIKEFNATKEINENDNNVVTISNEINRLKEIEIQECERQRIARELHDTTIQNLTHSIHTVELATKYIDIDIIRTKLELQTVIKSIRKSIDELRSVIYDLRPMTLDDMGFIPLIKHLENEISEKTSMQLSFVMDENITIKNKTVAITIYRIIKEACYNAVKHSGGTALDVSLKLDNSKLVIDITDNGKGLENIQFDNKDNHYGISIMKERVSIIKGNIEFVDNIKGTKIIIEIPEYILNEGDC